MKCLLRPLLTETRHAEGAGTVPKHANTVFQCLSCAANLKEGVECASLLKELEAEDAFVSELPESIKLFDELSKKFENALTLFQHPI